VNNPLRRSLLYVPAASEPMLRKARSRGADVLIVDLEDGVLPEGRPAARALAEAVWREAGFDDADVVLRINAPGSPWHEEDLAAAVRLRPKAVVLPKCEDAASVRRAAQPLGETPLFLMIETARGVLAAAELARLPHVEALVFGGADFRESLHALRHPEEDEIATARGLLVLAARGADREVFDTPFFDYRDAAGLQRSAQRGRTLGFDGKTAIHPGQLAAINTAFSPSGEEIERARRIVAAIEDAARSGRGVATVDGEMVEALHATEARRTLERARQAGLLG
jgi:citrate lyase subunit beta/citryl-CoA lyase